MAPPRKTYADRIADRSFLARRPEQRELLATDPLHLDPRWATFQTRYREARSGEYRYEVALELERALRVSRELALTPRPRPAIVGVPHEDRRPTARPLGPVRWRLPEIAEMSAEARLPAQSLLELRKLAIQRQIRRKDEGEISDGEYERSFAILFEIEGLGSTSRRQT